MYRMELGPECVWDQGSGVHVKVTAWAGLLPGSITVPIHRLPNYNNYYYLPGSLACRQSGELCEAGRLTPDRADTLGWTRWTVEHWQTLVAGWISHIDFIIGCYSLCDWWSVDIVSGCAVTFDEGWTSVVRWRETADLKTGHLKVQEELFWGTRPIQSFVLSTLC